MNDFDILKALNPHLVMECENPEALLHFNEEEPIEESVSTRKETYYPVYIFVCHTGSLLSSLIQLWTKDKFSHSLISFDASMTKMYSFGRKKLNDDDIITGANNGFAVDDINNEIYTNWKRKIRYATFVVFVTKIQRKNMLNRLQFFIDNKVKFKYDLPGLFSYAANLPHEEQFSYFCSGFVADILQAGNVLGDKRSYSLYSPQDLAELPMAYKVDEGEDFSAYREGKVKAKVKSAWNKFIKDTKIDPEKNRFILV